MRKQGILLVMTIVFALLLCGAVSAEDSQEVGGIENSTINSSTEDTSAIIDPEITLNINLEHPEALSGDKLPNVKVTDNDGNTINGITITKSGDNQYKVNFISNKTIFNLNVGALGHVNQTVTVPVSQITPTDPVLYGNATLNLRAYNLLILSGSPNVSPAFVNSNQALRDGGYYFNLSHFTHKDITSGDATIEDKIRQIASQADVIIIQMISEPDTVAKLKELISGTPAQIFAIKCGVAFLNDPDINSNDTELKVYWDNSGEENMARFQLKVLQNVGMAVDPSRDLSPVIYPSQFIYHPDSATPMFTTWNDYYNWYTQSGHYKSGSPWIGIIGYNTIFLNGNGAMLEAILRGLEEKGLNVILAITNGNTGRANAINNFFMNGNITRISALVACVGYTMVYSSSDAQALNKSIALLEKLNVPIFAPIYASDLEEWEQNSGGLSSEIYWQVAFPELEGRIEPVMLGGVVSAETDPYTGISVKRYTPLAERIERVISRVFNWTQLQTLPNEAKKIALIYYNLGGGKDGVGASYLNVPESISEILKVMKADGYTIPDEYSVEYIINVLTTVGNNVGSWAPGELQNLVEAGAITIPIEQYLQWFGTLPEELQQEVIETWGPVPGSVMVYNGSIVIPGIMLGNIFLGAQPMRGWGESSTDIAHSATLPPTHQYIAFYMWLQNTMQANAVIHLGTHGTLEWLPGRSVGLGEDDWPDILMGDIPNIYPYIVDNTGEGTQAKRRGYAVIIDHLTAPIIASGLYGDLAALQDLINSYGNTENPERKEILRGEILALVAELNIDQDLELDLENTSFDSILHVVEHHLEDLAATLMPYGLHTFGAALSGEILDQMVESIVSFDPVNRDNNEFRELIRNLLSQNYEMANLLAALRGEYISPALGGDPIRRAQDVLPTGMNFYSFDPRTAPDKTAWQIGSQMADEMLAAYYLEHGCFPETVGTVLWSTETMRTAGQTIAMILRYMGLEPDWDSSKKFKGVKVTSLENLTLTLNGVTIQRPRVDVMVTISGLFRDTFSYTVGVLDQAIRQAALLQESPNDNYVRKHYLEDLEKYTQSGMNSVDADILAGARIFGPPPEAYGTGLGQLIPSTSKWDDEADLLDTYLSRMSYIYGSSVYGLSGLEAFKNQLKNVDATIMVRDNNYGLNDNDDVFQFLGGMTLAARTLSGKDTDVYIANTRTNPHIETLGQFMSNEVRTRLLNPKWIEGMLNEGFSGANHIASEIGHLVAWDAVTPDAVADWIYQKTAETYFLNSTVRNQFLNANPYAFASAAAWLLEANRRGLWAADSATISQLKDMYMNTIRKYGVVCCHHTCGNMDFTNYVVVGSTLSQKQLQEFAAIMEAATGQTVTMGSTGTPSQSTGSTSAGATSSAGTSSGSQPSTESGAQSESESAETAGDDGTSKSYEVSETGQQSSAQSSMPIAAIVGVLILVSLVGLGYFRGAIFKK
ncbi:MAG TPA: cobaltochelatase subunit CobN [Methanobacterium sp.]|nr:cobaltochelatase subunit CobN [Methanobacterium sp.]HOI40003.1 cobaltochelatase subunit CobN [Methanobacterium sp.]